MELNLETIEGRRFWEKVSRRYGIPLPDNYTPLISQSDQHKVEKPIKRDLKKEN